MQDLLHLLGKFKGSGLIWWENQFLTVDPDAGYLLTINPMTDRTTVINGPSVQDWRGVTALTTDGTRIWVLRGDQILSVDLATWRLKLLWDLDSYGDGLAWFEQSFFVSIQDEPTIKRYQASSGNLLETFATPGVGLTHLSVHGDDLWACDQTEQTVFCLDPRDCTIRFSVLTPYEGPIGLAWLDEYCFVLYSRVDYALEPDPNVVARHMITDHTQILLHRLQFKRHQDYTLSNGYLIEMIYCEEIATLEPVALDHLVWKIALPWNTPRQKVLAIEPIGHPFREEQQGEQRLAVFEFEHLEAGEAQFFGWRALIEVYGIRYHIETSQVDQIMPTETLTQYLVDDDKLAMDTRRVREAARRAVGKMTNPLEKMLAIRAYVYDHLTYYIDKSISAPDEVLRKGRGSCGEYVGVLLALARLSGIPTRTCGRYKCPLRPDLFNYPLRPRYNHVWIEFYLPGFGWVPAESNADDIGNAPYPRRFFMALPWNYIELDKGNAFESTNVRGYSLGDLAINHVQFKIIKECQFD